jgi:hypothetical protein
MAEHINQHIKTVSTLNEKIKTSLIEELEVVKIKDLDKDGKIAVLPKIKIRELIGRSPDYSDALMMRILLS